MDLQTHSNGKQTPSAFSLYSPYSVEQAKSSNNQTETKDEENDESHDVTCSSCLTTYTEETSFSGLKYVGQRSSFYRRFFWLLVVLVAFSGLSYQMYRSTVKFIERPTNTKLSFKEEEVMEFPAVTFCNTNMFRIDKMLHVYSWVDLIWNGLGFIRKLFPQLGLSDREYYDREIPEQYPGNVSLYDFILNNGHDKEDMIDLCRFNGKECGPDNFTKTVTNYGVCYTFNSNSSLQSLPVDTPGQARGLSVFLNAEQAFHIASPRENAGFKMLVHPKDELPNIQDYGMELELGTHSAVRINTRELKLLSDPYGDCVKDGKQDLKFFGGTYTKSKCLIECERDSIVNKCGCRTYYMPGNSSSYCSPTDLIQCFHDAIDYFNGNKRSICKCEESCEQTVYLTSASQSTFPSYSLYVALALLEDETFESGAFFEKLTNTVGTSFWGIAEANAYHGSLKLMLKQLNNITDDHGNRFEESYPESLHYVTHSENVSGVLLSMQFDTFYEIAQFTYKEVKSLEPDNTHDASIGSPVYMGIERRFWTNKYKEELKHQFGEGLKHTYNSTSHNVSFAQFLDIIYEKYNIEGLFYEIFQEAYRYIHELLLTGGIAILSEDVKELTTQYIRNNIVHVDIFFGDLKVERITEQADYESFQFICDVGGALGLFFGASLLSFIETMDFCFCRRFKDKRDTKKGT